MVVLIPCRNEAPTIGKVVRELRAALPDAAILVCDNASTDATAARASEAGAEVITERQPGKGQAMDALLRHARAAGYEVGMFIDGDDTYPAESAPEIVGPVLSGAADMVVGARLRGYAPGAFHPTNLAGNRLLSSVISGMGRAWLTDTLSGMRAFRLDFLGDGVGADGFDVEPAITLRALRAGLRVVEVPIRYRPRPIGSASKLRPFRDGARILRFLVSAAARP